MNLFRNALLLFLLIGSAALANADKKATPDSRNRTPEDLIFGIPQTPDLLLTRRGFAIGYSQDRRQPLWVCYILTAEELSGPQVKRTNKFRIDPAVKYRPVTPRDYAGTGYDRGHLAPAGDMSYSVETMQNSFYMTNITPQTPGCNRGIWKRLESQVRQWAEKEKSLCIITGPLFPLHQKKLGSTEIPVPCAFYKVILDMTPPMKMIAFIVPNFSSKKRLQSFVVSVDEVELVTGYDFFSELPSAQQKRLEKQSNPAQWGL